VAPLLLLLAFQAGPAISDAALFSETATAARTLATLAEAREEAGDRPGAADLYRQALAKEELATGKSSARVAVLLNSLALLTDPPVAIPLLQRALNIDKQVWGAHNVETGSTEVNLAGALLTAGKTLEAVQMGTAGLATMEAVMGPDDVHTAQAASMLADALRAKRDFSGAEKLYRRALAIDEKVYGPGHAETLADIRNLIDLLHAQRRHTEAADLENRLTRP
jgi:tetratricopeptide (TPR) repeat protein